MHGVGRDPRQVHQQFEPRLGLEHVHGRGAFPPGREEIRALLQNLYETPDPFFERGAFLMHPGHNLAFYSRCRPGTGFRPDRPNTVEVENMSDRCSYNMLDKG